MMTRYALPVLLSLLPLVQTTQNATLTVDEAVARPGDTIHLTGSGFGRCRDPKADNMSVTISSDRGGIELRTTTPASPGGGIDVRTTVVMDPRPGDHEITASCTPFPGFTVAGKTSITIVVESDTVDGTGDQPAGDPSVTGGSGSSGSADPSATTTPVASEPISWSLVALALALAVLIGLGVRRLLSPAVQVRTLAGVVVGPRVRSSSAERDGIRIVTHPDPGRRVVTIRRLGGGGRS